VLTAGAVRDPGPAGCRRAASARPGRAAVELVTVAGPGHGSRPRAARGPAAAAALAPGPPAAGPPGATMTAA
jgi:hypothetical protein